MKVLFIEAGGSSGGSFESLYQYLAAVDQADVHPIVVLFSSDSPYVAKFGNLGVETIILRDLLHTNHHSARARFLRRLQVGVDLILPPVSVTLERLLHRRTVEAVAKLIRLRQVDIVHLNDQPGFNFFGFLLPEKVAVPVVSLARSMRGIGFNSRKARFAGRSAAYFIAVSQNVAAYWQDKGLPEEKFSVVYDAVSIPSDEVANLPILDEWRKQPGTFVLGCIANFLPEKGHEFLLEIIATARQRGVAIKVVLAGNGPLRSAIEKRASLLRIDDMLHFAGYVNNASAVMRAVDAVIVPSEREGFPRAIIEAMSVGTPVIATSVGGIPEVVVDGVTGILIPYGDVEVAAQRLAHFVEARVERGRFAQAGHAIVAERCSMQSHIDGLQRIYAAVTT